MAMMSVFSQALTIAAACGCALILVAAAAAEDGLLPVMLEGRVVGAAAVLGSAMAPAVVQAVAMAAAAAVLPLQVLDMEAAAATLDKAKAEAPAQLAAAAAALSDPLPLTHNLRDAILLKGVLLTKVPPAVAKDAAAMRSAPAQADLVAQLDGALTLIHLDVALEGAAAQGTVLTMLLSPAQVAALLLSRIVTVMLADVVPDSGPALATLQELGVSPILPFLALLEHGRKLVAAQAARLGEGRAQGRAPC